MSIQTRRDISADQIDACLPQTQCTQCGYPRCRAYAEALAAGSADINQCPPGGDSTIRALAVLWGTAPKPLDPRFGSHKRRARAVINETLCIGCRKCIDACPVDAILGARKLMHTVIGSECTGCELCLPPCPVDCIAMELVSASDDGPWPEYTCAETEHWRRRTEQRIERLAHPTHGQRAKTVNGVALSARAYASFPSDKEKIRADIHAAVARVQVKKKNRQD